MKKFKVKCVQVPDGISAINGRKKDMSMFEIGMVLTVVSVEEYHGNTYYEFKEIFGNAIGGDSYNAKYFEKI